MNCSQSKKDIALVYPPPLFDSIPSLCNTVRLLAQSGYGVEILTTTDYRFVTPKFNEENIKLTIVHKGFSFHKIDEFRKKIKSQNKLVNTFVTLIRIALAFTNMIIKKIKIATIPLLLFIRHKRNYCCFIGVDPDGLIIASHCARLIGVPVIYFSLELLLSHELSSPFDKILKQKELASSKHANFIIIQDKDRALLMSKDNKIPLNRFVFVPNSPLGFAKRRKTNYWYKRFNLSPEIKIVLHSGGIDSWTGIKQIASSVENWPENWVLIIHTRYSTEQNEKIKALQKFIQTGKVFLSLNPVSWQEYNDIVDSADIGIAFYISTPGSYVTQENIKTMGLSSGKIAYYLKSGLPVIVNQESSLGDLILQAKCGISVNSSNDISNAITTLSKNYDEYSTNAQNFFNLNLNFEKRFSQVIHRIDELENVN